MSPVTSNADNEIKRPPDVRIVHRFHQLKQPRRRKPPTQVDQVFKISVLADSATLALFASVKMGGVWALRINSVEWGGGNANALRQGSGIARPSGKSSVIVSKPTSEIHLRP